MDNDSEIQSNAIDEAARIIASLKADELQPSAAEVLIKLANDALNIVAIAGMSNNQIFPKTDNIFPKTDNARLFGEIMAEIWDDDTRGLYDEWHNARKAAEYCSAKRLWAMRVDGEPGYAYQFADGSRAAINTQGSAIKQINRQGHFA